MQVALALYQAMAQRIAQGEEKSDRQMRLQDFRERQAQVRRTAAWGEMERFDAILNDKRAVIHMTPEQRQTLIASRNGYGAMLGLPPNDDFPTPMEILATDMRDMVLKVKKGDLPAALVGPTLRATYGGKLDELWLDYQLQSQMGQAAAQVETEGAGGETKTPAPKAKEGEGVMPAFPPNMTTNDQLMTHFLAFEPAVKVDRNEARLAREVRLEALGRYRQQADADPKLVTSITDQIVKESERTGIPITAQEVDVLTKRPAQGSAFAQLLQSIPEELRVRDGKPITRWDEFRTGEMQQKAWIAQRADFHLALNPQLTMKQAVENAERDLDRRHAERNRVERTEQAQDRVEQGWERLTQAAVRLARQGGGRGGGSGGRSGGGGGGGTGHQKAPTEASLRTVRNRVGVYFANFEAIYKDGKAKWDYFTLAQRQQKRESVERDFYQLYLAGEIPQVPLTGLPITKEWAALPVEMQKRYFAIKLEDILQ
jgi:hypothetical protein